MRGRRRSWAAALAALVGLLAVSAVLSQTPQRDRETKPEGQPVAMPPGVTSLLLSLGLRDEQPSDWGGELSLSAGSIVELQAVDESRVDSIQGQRWTLRTRRVPAKAKTKAKAKAPANEPIAAARLVALLEAPPTAIVEVNTPRGRFALRLAELPLGARRTFLDGAVAVEQTPLTRQVTRAEGDEDYPVAAPAGDGSAWCAYVAYRHGAPPRAQEVENGRFDSLDLRDNGDQVKLLRFADNAWSPAPIDVTGPGLDVWRPAVAVDGRGLVWVVWSQRKETNWDLYARSYDPRSGTLGETRQLTTEAGADIQVVAASGSRSGTVWLAWQAWRDGNFDILLARLEDDGPLRPQQVSTSRANDWSPAIAVASRSQDQDEVWVAWDTYAKGDYDVYARRLAGGRLDEPVPIATSARFEARPSIAIDGRDRLWVAFEDADANWGKDYGSRFPGRQGVPLYLERQILVRCREQGELRQAKEPIRSDLIDTHYDDTKHPKERRHRVSIPRLGLDDRGSVWLFFRRHPASNGEGERWASFATRYEGDRWSPAVALRHSENTLDQRPALIPMRGGGLLAVYATDYRTAGSPSARTNDLFAARLDRDATAPAPELVAARPEDPGERIEPIHPDEAEQVERLRSYRFAAGGRTYRPLRGDFHRHTEFSAHRDWDGPMEDFWRYGLDVAALDWIGPTDHEYAVAVEYLWWLTQKEVDLYHHAPQFVPMFTYERSLPYPSGHRNVMFARRGVRPLPPLVGERLRFGTPEAGAPDVKNLYAFLRHFDGICSSHTSATSMGTDWRDNDPEVEPVVEIMQGHRQNYEEPKAPQAPRDADDSIQGYHPDGFVWNALAKGYRLGFQSSSDHVSTHISYAIALAEEPTRAGVLAAFKKRHVYAAQDNIVLDVRCGDHLMGDELTVSEPPALDITVLGTAPIARLDIVRQSDKNQPIYVYNTEPNRREVKLRWKDEAAEAGRDSMYYVRIQQADAKLAWASPLWVRYRP